MLPPPPPVVVLWKPFLDLLLYVPNICISKWDGEIRPPCLFCEFFSLIKFLFLKGRLSLVEQVYIGLRDPPLLDIWDYQYIFFVHFKAIQKSFVEHDILTNMST